MYTSAALNKKMAGADNCSVKPELTLYYICK